MTALIRPLSESLRSSLFCGSVGIIPCLIPAASSSGAPKPQGRSTPRVSTSTHRQGSGVRGQGSGVRGQGSGVRGDLNVNGNGFLSEVCIAGGLHGSSGFLGIRDERVTWERGTDRNNTAPAVTPATSPATPPTLPLTRLDSTF